MILVGLPFLYILSLFSWLVPMYDPTFSATSFPTGIFKTHNACFVEQRP